MGDTHARKEAPRKRNVNTGKAPRADNPKPHLPAAPKLPKMGQRERNVLGAIRAGAQGIGGLEDRCSGSYSGSLLRRSVATLIEAGLIAGGPEGPWELTGARDPEAIGAFRQSRRRLTGVVPIPESPSPSTSVQVSVCPHMRTSHCPHCHPTPSDAVPARIPTRMADASLGDACADPRAAPSTYADAERAIKTPVAIVSRTSDTLLL